MKIIDEKGKLFGLVNIIDLSVLLVVVLLVGVGAYKTVGKKLKISGTTTSVVYVTVRCPLLSEIVAKALQDGVGDKLVAGNNYIDGVIDSAAYTDAISTVTTEDGRIVSANNPLKKDAIVVMKINMNTDPAVMKLDPQEVHIGDKYMVKTHTVAAEGYIENIEFK